MKHYYCTYFDSNYLLKGLCLHQSLLNWDPDFTLYILCMDDRCYELLNKMKLANVKLIRLQEFLDTDLKRVQPTRSRAEFCWTMTPSLPLFVLQHDKKIDQITYLDADLFFYASPQPIFDEIGQAEIAAIEHRYPSYHEQNASGRFCVQFQYFSKGKQAQACLKRWRKQCIEWCYDRHEDGKYGDQKYLDEWPSKYSSFHIIQHLGAGVAPWNIMQYRITASDQKIFVNDQQLIFYHFHQFNLYSDHSTNVDWLGYPLSSTVKKLIYAPYITAHTQAMEQVLNVDKNWTFFYPTKYDLRTKLNNFYSQKLIQWKRLLFQIRAHV